MPATVIAETEAGLEVDPHRPCRVLAQAPVLTWMSDGHGRVVFLSDHWADFTGVHVPGLLVGGLFDVTHPDDRQQAAAVLRGPEPGRAQIVREYRLRRADGAWRFMLDTAKPVRDEAGNPSGHAGVCEDVTERHELLALTRFQRTVSACLAHSHAGPVFLEELLRTICVEGGFDEATVCRVSRAEPPTRLLLRFSGSRFDSSECACWCGGDLLSTPMSRPPYARSAFPIVGSSPLVAGGDVTGLLTLGSGKGVDVFLPLLKSFHGTASILGAILDRERVEENLRASEERYRSLLEQSSEGIHLFDPVTHRVLDANPRFLQMTGYERQDLATLTLEDVVSSGVVALATNISRVVTNGEVVLLENVYRRRDGSTVPVDISASLVRWGGESAVLVNVRDVSELRSAATALVALSRRLQLVLDSAGEGILGLEARGRMTFVNRSAAVLLGWNAEEPEGRESHPLWHHTKRDGTPHSASECPILATIRTGKRVTVSEDVFWRRDGTKVLVEFVSTPLREKGQLT